MKFDQVEIEDVRAVFGDVGAYLAEGVDYEIGDVSRVLTDDDGNVTMELTEDGCADPYVRIHEFAHYYHCILFQELSEAVLPYRAEAVAFLAEKMFEEKRHVDPGWSERRIEEWRVALEENPDLRPLLDVVEAAARLPDEDIRGTVGFILAGGLG